MEEETQRVQIDGREGGDEFYEKIEAPKFVNFMEADPYRPDDRYWFCMRVGCDQKHEEELDHEAVYKNFILRVMAARSPNVKLRKTLSRKVPSLKCPLTAPAKSSKPRVSRLALISSFSHKMFDGKDIARPLRKACTTPNLKAKQPSSVAKALSTPRNRKPISNLDTFHSVRNPKPKNVMVPKNRVVAKALVFPSPMKVVRTKASMEWRSPVGKKIPDMKKLEIITSGKKHVLGYNKPFPIDTSKRKQVRGREVKSRVFDSLHSNKSKRQEEKSMKIKNKEKDPKQHCPVPDEVVDDNDSSDMEVGEKSRKGLEVFCLSGTSQNSRPKGSEKCLETGKTSEPPVCENQVELLTETVKDDTASLSRSKERDSKDKDYKENAEEGIGLEGKTKLNSEMGNNIEHMNDDDNKENTLASDTTENDNEAFQSDDKKNNTDSDDDRELNVNGHSKRINLGKHDASKNSQKVKVQEENCTSVATSAHGVKHRKPTPTNPKPFRFRTDERGILKESILEKKVQEPLKETTLVKLPGAKSTKKHPDVIPTNKSCLGQSDNENDAQAGSAKRLDRRMRLHENEMKGTASLKTSKGDFERKLSVVTPQRHKVSLYEKTSPERVQKSERERTKSPMVQQRSARLKGLDSSRKKTIVSSKTPCQLSVIKETSSTNLRPKKAAKPCSASPVTKDSACTPCRSLSRGKRPATIPKEPQFHSIHVPKTCTGGCTRKTNQQMPNKDDLPSSGV